MTGAATVTVVAPGGSVVVAPGTAAALSGEAPPGSTVTVTEGGEALATATATAEGTWVVTIPALPPGTHELTVAAAAPDGTPVGETVTVAVFVGPKGTPGAATVTVAAPAGSVVVAPGTAAALSGEAPPGSTVSVTEGGEALATATATAEGIWVVTIPALPPGTHELTVTAAAPDGTPAGEPVAAAVTVGPGVIGADRFLSTLPAGPVRVAAGLAALLKGEAGPSAQVRLVRDGIELSRTEAGPDGKWALTSPALPAGEYQVRLELLAPDGTVAATSDPIALTVAGAPGGEPGSGPTQVPEPAVTGAEPTQVPAGGGVIAAGGPTPATADATPAEVGSATPAAPLPAEPATTVNLVLPVLTTRLPAIVAGALPSLVGTSAPNATVLLYDGDTVIAAAVADANGNWSFLTPYPLTPGDHLVRLAVTAPDGTVHYSDPANLSVAAVAEPIPPIRVFRPAGGQVMPGGALAGTAPPGARIEIYQGDALVASVIAAPDGSWIADLPAALAPGVFDFSARLAGGPGAASSKPVVMRLEVAPPALLPTTGG
jgi:hypothetical protein